MRIINGSNYDATVNCANGMLWTFADGGNSSNRNLIPETDAARSLGTSSKRWSNVYVSGTLSDGTNSASVSTLNNKISALKFTVDQSGEETVSPDLTNHAITFNLNPGNNVTISKSSGTNLISYNISATDRTTRPSGVNVSIKTMTSSTSLACNGGSLTGGTYGTIYYITIIPTSVSSQAVVSRSSASSSMSYCVVSARAIASGSGYTLTVVVPYGVTWYL